MAFVVGPSRNPIVQAAFAGLRKEQRAEKKAPKEEVVPVKSKNAPQPRAKGRKQEKS